MINVAVFGASGYTGAELVRLLANHPLVTLKALTANTQAGKNIADIFPHLTPLDLPVLSRIEDVNLEEIEVVFCALPHGTTQQIVAGLPNHLKIIDLSADFRLTDTDTYQTWYNKPHDAPALQKHAVYGLTELKRASIKNARLVANPGCYTTTCQLPLIPLLKAGLIETTDIIIDSKSGVSGAGRTAKQNLQFCEVQEGFYPYALEGHRHCPEIEQECSLAARQDVRVSFTPHLVPMSRGILSTCYVKPTGKTTIEDIRSCLEETYKPEFFVHLLAPGVVPQTGQVKGSNHCFMNVFKNRLPNYITLVSTLDNLVKGASGQAIQNMNIMCEFEETTGLTQLPLFP